MISVILYGRNDSHGYNLHKRAAISLNCIAEVLSAPRDEIVFVDYNTPDDFPSFPEAIADTLTDRTKKLLRILRVRSQHHERFRYRTQLVAVEAVARNVGVRRSNPDNRWILSTNTDMIFVPRRQASLSEIVAGLEDAYYHLPRFELPEPLWESLDRLQAARNIVQVGEWGRAFHLNEIACIQYDQTKYDAPGDFQLMLRSDIWKIHGFHEDMLLSLHVDSNIAMRLALLPRRRGELVDELFAYHCDHLRQLTLAHQQHGQRNDVQSFVENVASADVPEQSETWGLAGEPIEELSLTASTGPYIEALRATIPAPMTQPSEFVYTGPKEQYAYSVDHVLPFLEGSLASYPRSAIVAWVGTEKPLLQRFAASWTTMGFCEPLLVHENARWLGSDLPPHCRWATPEEFEEQPRAFVFDFGQPPKLNGVVDREAVQRLDFVLRTFRSTVKAELQGLRQHRSQPRRFIGVNTILNDRVTGEFEGRISVPVTPNSTRIKQGVVIAEMRSFYQTGQMSCMSLLIFGTAALIGPPPHDASKRAIHSRPGVQGVLVYGPYVALPPGKYEVKFEFYARAPLDRGRVLVDVAADRGNRVLARGSVNLYGGLRWFQSANMRRRKPVVRRLRFKLDEKSEEAEEAIEFRVFSPGTVDFCLSDLSVRQISPRLTERTRQDPAGQNRGG